MSEVTKVAKRQALRLRVLHLSIITEKDIVYFYLGHEEVAVILFTLWVNAYFAYATHDIFLAEDAGTLAHLIGSLGGIGYLIVFFVTSFSLYFDGKKGLWFSVLLFELIMAILSITEKSAGLL